MEARRTPSRREHGQAVCQQVLRARRPELPPLLQPTGFRTGAGPCSRAALKWTEYSGPGASSVAGLFQMKVCGSLDSMAVSIVPHLQPHLFTESHAAWPPFIRPSAAKASAMTGRRILFIGPGRISLWVPDAGRMASRR